MTYRPVVVASLVALAFVLAPSCATSPEGRRQLIIMPESQMNAMGTQAFGEMKAKTTIETNPAVTAYVRCVAQKVVDVVKARQGGGDWEIVVFRDSQINAFALPGGKIGVYTGILPVAKTQHQLAAIIGHEVGHVLARHGNERVSETLAAQGGLIAASAALNKEGSTRTAILAALGLGAQYGVLLPHGRTQESEADIIGLDLMAQAGFDPRESVELWKNMGAAGGGQPPEFLSTHPSHETRISGLQSRMNTASATFQQARAAGKHPNCQM
ncbi:MAG: M48 family metallopeptidase [Bacteriovoracia bacterium]